MITIVLSILVFRQSFAYFSELDVPSVDSCIRKTVTMNDKNWRAVIGFYRGCRNFGLAQYDGLPRNFMKKLTKQLKQVNKGFLENTSLPKSKIREIEREINDLYNEVGILATSRVFAKPRCLVTTTPCPVSEEYTVDYEIPEDDEVKVTNDILDYNYDTGLNAACSLSLYLYLLAVCLATLLVSLCICRYVRKIHKYIELAPNEEEDESAVLQRTTKGR